jgi:hypothetical protein
MTRSKEIKEVVELLNTAERYDRIWGEAPRWPDDIECRRCAKCHTPLIPIDIGVWRCENCNSNEGYMYLGASRKKSGLKIEIVEI